jgi:uncharacterized Ntn-hydrolase superfamily protein
MTRPKRLSVLILLTLSARSLDAQEPVSWGVGDTLTFHTFSIAAVDPRTGESGVAVTTRVACVGNGVPWVRAGVGAVATQAFTRVEYGMELLDMLAQGMSPREALDQATAADPGAARRQVGVVSLDGSGAQHTGDSTSPWAGQRSGPNFVTQGNLLVGPQVVEAVAANFQSTEGSNRHLGDRLIEALMAGQMAGGDARKGRAQSAAVVVADPRQGRSRRPDGITVNINVCEHPTPVLELRRVWNTISQTLGYRTLQQFSGQDVWQLRVMLSALGAYRPGEAPEEMPDRFLLTDDLVQAVNAFRTSHDLAGPEAGVPPGLVDAETVGVLWEALESAGRAEAVRAQLLDATAVRR